MGKKDVGLAIVEQATTPHQKVNITTLKNCANDFKDKKFSSPSLVIVGDVVNLYQQFKWFNAENEGSLFKEL